MAETSRTNGLIGTLGIKAPCRAATVANITLTGAQTVDGVVLAAGDRVLVKDQTDATLNGIYYVETGAWTRAPDFDGAQDVLKGTTVNVNEGTVNAVTQWRVTSADPVIPDTSAITFSLSATAFGADIAGLIHAATEKTRPVGADEGGFWDSVSNSLRRMTVASMRSTTYAFDGFTEAQQNDVLAGTEALDVRAALQAQIDTLDAVGGGVLDLPRGVYSIGAALVLPPKVFLRGAGSAVTKIRLRAASNSNILQTKDFATLTGSNKWLVSEGVPTHFGFDGITFDGNRANQTVAGGVALYGKNYYVGFDVKVIEPKGIGFYSECAYKGGQTVEQDMPEGHIGKVQVYKSGREGFVYRGPHDQPIHDISVSQAGQDGIYDGVAFEGQVNLYNGATYVTGSVHAYACTRRGITLRTHVLANQLTGENCDQDGVVFEATGETAGMIGGTFANVDLVEAYGNDNNDTGLYWGVRISGGSNTLSSIRVSSSGQAAGGVFAEGNFTTISGGTITGSNAIADGTGLKISSNYHRISAVIQSFDSGAAVGLRTESCAYSNINVVLYNCSATGWLNSGTSSNNMYSVRGFSSAGTPFSQTGTFAATDNFDVDLNYGGTSYLSKYNDSVQRGIIQPNAAVTVTHNGFKTPTSGDITITPDEKWAVLSSGAARNWWISNITATTFDVNVSTAVEVAETSLLFHWKLDM
jgi:hypothetical protein